MNTLPRPKQGAMRELLLATALFATVAMSCGDGEATDTARDVAPEPTRVPETTPIPERTRSSAPTPVRPTATPEAVPTPTVSQSIVPLPFRGTFTYEEEILRADVIVRARFVSAAAAVEYKAGAPDRDFPAMEFTFTVLEYLRGSGRTTIKALVLDTETAGIRTRENALAKAQSYIAARDTTYDTREAILFLQRLDKWPTTVTGDTYYLGLVNSRHAMDDYSVAGREHKVWLPAVSPTTTQGRATGATKSFLLDDPRSPTAEPPINGNRGNSGGRGAGGDTTSSPTLTLTNMKAAITRITAETAAGTGPTYARCLTEKYSFPRETAYNLAQGWGPFERIRIEAASGMPAGSTVYETNLAVGLMPNNYGNPTTWRSPDFQYFDDRRSDQVHPFHWGSEPPDPPDAFRYTSSMISTRPLSAGEYRLLSRGGLPATRAVCNAPSATADWSEVERTTTVVVTAPDFAVYEAMFDPVADGTAVKAASVLKPYTATGADTATVSSLSWESGTLRIGMDPVTAHSGKYIDFIDVDGDLAYSVKISDATVDATAKTLSWSVAEALWAAGDKMMLRIYEKVASTCTVTEGAMKPGACYAAPVFTGAPFSFTVSRDPAVGSTVGTVSVSHPESTATTLSIIAGDPGGHFAISDAGAIRYREW